MQEILNKEVLDYAKEFGLLKPLLKAITIAYGAFKSLKKLETRIMQNPEGDDKWIVIDVIVDGSIADVLHQKDQYANRWINTEPFSIRDKIRLLYHCTAKKGKS